MSLIKKILDHIVRNLRPYLLGALAVFVISLGIRLSMGPMRIDGLKPLLIKRIEAQFPGYSVELGHVDLAWFSDAHAVGLIIEHISLNDKEKREIASANHLEAALAVESLIVGHVAPARMSAKDYFIVLSVSPEGRYDLGYNAHGKPEGSIDIQKIWLQLSGKETLGDSLSFIRQIYFRKGRLKFVQSDGTEKWTADLNDLSFSKLKGGLQGHFDMAIVSQGHKAHLLADARGTIGLTQFSFLANLKDFSPAAILPSTGPLGAISNLAAPVSGSARFDYSAKRGFEAAYVDVTAGEGFLTLGDIRHPFEFADIKAIYFPSDKSIRFQSLKIRYQMLDANMAGLVRIKSGELAKANDVGFDFDLTSKSSTARLSADFPAQTITNVYILGNYQIAKSSLTFDKITAELNNTPLVANGRIYTDNKGYLGAELTASLNGAFSKEAVFAFWPAGLGRPVRNELIARIHKGDFYNARFTLNAPPGHFEPYGLKNEDLRLDFDFNKASVIIDKRMKPATDLRGKGRLEGNRFSLDVESGMIESVKVTKGLISVPDFIDKNTRVLISIVSASDITSIIHAVDPITNGQLSKNGLGKVRLGGFANASVEVSFPTHKPINSTSLNVVYKGTIKNARFNQAALGWDLVDANLNIEGNLLADTLHITGVGNLGPYRGQISFASEFEPKVQDIAFSGDFDASSFGGSPYVRVPIAGTFKVANGAGNGKIQSDIFTGVVNWQRAANDDQGRPSDVVIEGNIISQGMREQGLPMFKRLKPEIPTRISLSRAGDIWSGQIEAEDLSGNIAYIQGVRSRLVYQTTLTKEKAINLGLGALPMFDTPKPLTVNVALDDSSNEAIIKLDTITAVLGWHKDEGSDTTQRVLNMKLMPEDWAKIGLPQQYFTPQKVLDVTALWQADQDSLIGKFTVADQVFDFDMPSQSNDQGYGLKVTGIINDTLLQTMGYSQDPITFKGQASFLLVSSEARTAESAKEPTTTQTSINVDASGADLTFVGSSWHKPLDQEARFSMVIAQPIGAKGADISRIYAESDKIKIEGRAAFDEKGRLSFADFSRVYLADLADVSVRFYDVDETGTKIISIKGKELDLRPWLQKKSGKPVLSEKAVLNDAQSAWIAQPMHLVVNVDKLKMAPDSQFNNLALDMTWDGKSSIDGNGQAEVGGHIPVTLSVKGAGSYSHFIAETSSIGDVVHAMTGSKQLRGGSGSLEGFYQDGQFDATLKGKKINAREIPFLAQILTVASLQGLANTLTGEGIRFDSFEIPIRYKDHLVFVNDGWAKGDAIGLNFKGTINTDTEALGLSGTLIPAYGFNSIFGDVSANGLGLVGLKYSVSGTYKAPQSVVNPLSLVLPGFVKKWFDQKQDDPIAPLGVSISKAKAVENNIAATPTK